MFAFGRKLVASLFARPGVKVAFTVGVLFTLQTGAAERAIQLRNQRIDTSAGKRAGLRVATAAPVSGLYLIQVTGHLPEDWREQLSALNISIARPVPQDAFVVELKETNL